MSTTKPYTLAGYAADRAHGDLDQDAMRATVEALDAAKKRIAELEAESADSDQLIGLQSSLLTATVNMLRGAPPSDTLWSHHDVADLARQWVDRAHAAESERDSWKARAELKWTRLLQEHDSLRAEVERLRAKGETLAAEALVLLERCEAGRVGTLDEHANARAALAEWEKP